MRYYGNKRYSRTGYIRQYNKAHALCMLDNKSYRHTLRMYDFYCFSTAKMVTGTCHNTTLYVHCLSLLMLPAAIVIWFIV